MADILPDGDQKKQHTYRLEGFLSSAAYLFYQHSLSGAVGMSSSSTLYGDSIFATMVYSVMHNGYSATEYSSLPGLDKGLI